MRGSLRETAVGRLGNVDYALAAGNFVRQDLAEELESSEPLEARFEGIAPVISASASIVHAGSEKRANGISVFGVDARFWKMRRLGGRAAALSLRGRSASGEVPKSGLSGRPEAHGSDRNVVLNEPLADELGARRGDDVIVRLHKPSAISPETLLGHRSGDTVTLRLSVSDVIAAIDLGAFSLRPRQITPKDAFIPLPILQRALGQEGRVNTLLVGDRTEAQGTPEENIPNLRQALRAHVTLADLGVTMRRSKNLHYIAIESDAMLLPPPVESAVTHVLAHTGDSSSRILTYLANQIAREQPEPVRSQEAPPDQESGAAPRSIPYSTVTALDPEEPTYRSIKLANGQSIPSLGTDEILLNTWAATDLGAQIGDRIRLTYYVTAAFGRLETRDHRFILRGIVALDGAAADPGLTPEYHGVTDAENLAEWDPPFPMDVSTIRPKDETYWDKYRAAPKAFISLKDGQRLWAAEGKRFGNLTAIRIHSAPGVDLAERAAEYARRVTEAVDLERLGLIFRPVRAEAIAASRGTTDFGMLFVGFSFFLIVSAALLVALLFRLGVERRAAEIGLLLAVGFGPPSVTRLLMLEGLAVAAVGAGVGLLGSLAYARFMLMGLQSWWSSAVHAPFLHLFVSPATLAVGGVASLAIAGVSIAWSTRGLTGYPAGSLLAGAVAAGGAPKRGMKIIVVRIGWATLFLVSLLLMFVSSRLSGMLEAMGFFLSGASLLLGSLAVVYDRLVAAPSGIITPKPKGTALTRVGMRNARRHRSRSMLTAGLIASATFLVASLQTFYVDVRDPGASRRSGTGGFRLYAESTVPLLRDLNTTEGRRALAMTPDASRTLEGTQFMAFRLRPGDVSSCLNLYRPNTPRILGAPQAMIRRGGFTFAATLADTPAERENPWTLLMRSFPDGAVPVIGDESAVQWQLHQTLGDTLTITDERGREVKLRFVALLAQSMLQDELIVSEANFVDLFPSISGYAFFLIEAPAATTADVERTLERELETYGFDVSSAAARLREYLAVQNTYLSTFQMLGGFGLILGTIGLAAVMLRNVWERRGELALMRAVGFSRLAIGWIVLTENVALLLVGLVAGGISALLAVAPHLVSRPGTIPWVSLAAILFGVFAVGTLAGIAAIAATLRAPLIPALRRE